MKLQLNNWKCIASADIELGRVNAFFGKNSSGKSSAAYALYILGRAAEGEDPNVCTKNLQGKDLKSLVSVENGKKKLPMAMSVSSEKDVTLAVITQVTEKGNVEYAKSEGKIWNETHVAVAGRYGLLLAWLSWPEFVSKEIPEKEGREMVSQMFSIFPSLLAMSEALAPSKVFLEELLGEFRKVRDDDLETGSYQFETFIPIFLTLFQSKMRFRDIIDKKLELSVREAPSGLVDEAVIDLIVSGAEKHSLVVVEEPEEHKNPLQQINLVRRLVDAAKEKELTLVLTTHSEIIIHALLSEVEKKRLTPEELKLHYFKRDKEHPWTEVQEIKVYEDGSIEEPLEDFMEATSVVMF